MATRAMRIQSADDVLHIEVPPGIHGYELVDGELVEVMPAGLGHGRISAELCGRIRDHVRDHRIAGATYVDAGYVLGLRKDPERMRGPDVSFVSQTTRERFGGQREYGFFRGVPDLAIEVESPERPKALQQRIQDYIGGGTRLLWVIHLMTRSATVYRADGSARLLRESDMLDGEDVLPGLQIPLRELFSD